MLGNLYDQAVPAPRNVYLDIVQTANSMIGAAVEEQDDANLQRVALDAVVNMRTRGVALAALLYGWCKYREAFGIESEDDWIDHVQASCGISAQTNRKYRKVWGVLFENPSISDFVKNELIGKPMQGLLLLPAAVAENQLSEDDWDEIVNSGDAAEIRDVVRRVRGEATSSGTAIVIKVDRNGILTAWRNGESENIGFLKLEEYLSEFGEAAVDRIINGAGLVRD